MSPDFSHLTEHGGRKPFAIQNCVDEKGIISGGSIQGNPSPGYPQISLDPTGISQRYFGFSASEIRFDQPGCE